MHRGTSTFTFTFTLSLNNQKFHGWAHLYPTAPLNKLELLKK